MILSKTRKLNRAFVLLMKRIRNGDDVSKILSCINVLIGSDCYIKTDNDGIIICVGAHRNFREEVLSSEISHMTSVIVEHENGTITSVIKDRSGTGGYIGLKIEDVFKEEILDRNMHAVLD